MAFAGLLGTIRGLTIRYNFLQNKQGHISDKLMDLLRQSTNFNRDYQKAKNAIANTYDRDSVAYKVEMEKIEAEHDFSMANLDRLNNEFDEESIATQNEAKLVKEQRDDYKSMAKANIEEDMKYMDTGNG